MRCVRETPHIKTKHEMFKRTSPNKTEGNTGSVRETPKIEKRKKKEKKPACDV